MKVSTHRQSQINSINRIGSMLKSENFNKILIEKKTAASFCPHKLFQYIYILWRFVDKLYAVWEQIFNHKIHPFGCFKWFHFCLPFSFEALKWFYSRHSFSLPNKTKCNLKIYSLFMMFIFRRFESRCFLFDRFVRTNNSCQQTWRAYIKP